MREPNHSTYQDDVSQLLTAQAALKNECPPDELPARSSLLPTTMIGTRLTVTLTFSPSKRARHEAEYVAGLSLLGKLHHRFFGFLRKQSD